jgi:phage portal protein BeeE
MKWPSWLNPLNWFRRDITAAQMQSLGLYAPSAAGVYLTPEVAEGISAVYCADRVISEDLASLPMVVYSGHRLDDDSEPLRTDRVSRLLAKPNPEQTGPVFWSALQHDANFWGFGLAEIVWDGAGRPAELWHLPATTVRVDRERGRLVFHAPGPDGREVTRLKHHDVLFIPGFSPDGSVGYRLLNLARLTLGTAAAVQQFAAPGSRTGCGRAGPSRWPGCCPTPPGRTCGELAGAVRRARERRRPDALEEGTGWEPFEIAHNDQLQLTQSCRRTW